MAPAVPLATYRLQFNKGFRFRDAEAIVPYLRRLGVSHVYASPLLASRAGSTHGYDVIDPASLDPELGTEDDFLSLLARLRTEGLGLVLDIVPNHMAADVANPWWRDVLVHGPSSQYAGYFDIDWEGGGGKLVLPALGRPPKDAIANGEIGVAQRGDGHWVTYYDKRWPVRPETQDLARRAQEGGSDAVAALLDAQAYRLAHWRTEPPNYRRFFDISDLASVRAEREEVFDATHGLALRLLSTAEVSALRVDHVDGLYDPAAYLRRMRDAAGDDAYIVVEKVLAGAEQLPRDWPVEGTTGYDFLAAVNGLFVDHEGLRSIGRAYTCLTGVRHGFRHEVRTQKRRILEMLFANEVASLTRWLAAILRDDLGLADVPQGPLSAALMEVTAELPVYRTYADSSGMSPGDVRLVDGAAGRAGRRLGALASPLLGPLRRILALDYPAGLPDERQAEWTRAVMRWQQLSGPATAKGLEDTAFYRYSRLISLNEVGADAEAKPPDRVHRFLRSRARAWPYTMNATSTHDTKRSEDVRARINALSWTAEDWTTAVRRWAEWNARWKQSVDGAPAPDGNMEWLLYQTLVGAWPLTQEDEPGFLPRLQTFLSKAAREAKEHTSWLDVNSDYEDALHAFAETLLDPARSGRFLSDLRRLVRRVAPLGAVASLAQLAVKALAPGVPDFYQGQELWDFSLTDPDNRRQVDYARRISLASQTSLGLPTGIPAEAGTKEPASNEAALEDLVQHWTDGRLKLQVTHRLLGLRAEMADLFRDGDYLPLDAGGRLFAFARRRRAEWVAVVVPRVVMAPGRMRGLPLGARLAGRSVVALPAGAPGRWRNVLTGEEHAARGGGLRADLLLKRLPVAVLAVKPFPP